MEFYVGIHIRFVRRRSSQKVPGPDPDPGTKQMPPADLDFALVPGCQKLNTRGRGGVNEEKKKSPYTPLDFVRKNYGNVHSGKRLLEFVQMHRRVQSF